MNCDRPRSTTTLYRIVKGTKKSKHLYTKKNAETFCLQHGITNYELEVAVEGVHIADKGTTLHTEFFVCDIPHKSPLF